jgi:hypothetical protein
MFRISAGSFLKAGVLVLSTGMFASAAAQDRDAQDAKVTVANAPSVKALNTPSTPIGPAPLIIRDADNPARSFFQKNFSFVVADGSFGGTVDLGTVPANFTLVIEYINMVVRLPGQQGVTTVFFQEGAFDTLGFAPIQTISNTGTDSTWIVAQPVKMYVPANSSMKLFFGRTSSTGISQFGSVEISGYLVAN